MERNGFVAAHVWRAVRDDRNRWIRRANEAELPGYRLYAWHVVTMLTIAMRDTHLYLPNAGTTGMRLYLPRVWE